ncbi:SdpI family protein [Neobacillus mesonae]|nr:SdpI family protein [Neobacillus mesonae]
MKRHWFGLVLLIISMIGTCFAYPYLPDQIGVHWNFRGEPNSFANKSYGAFLFPVIMLLFYLMRILLSKVDPKKNNYQRFGDTYALIMNGILLFLFVFQAVHLITSLGFINPKYVLPEIIGLLLIFIGNFCPKFKPNYFIGIRTPWTLASEDVWKKKHRFGGKVFVVLGLLMILVPIIPAALQLYYVIIVLLGGLGAIVFSSYYFFIKI